MAEQIINRSNQPNYVAGNKIFLLDNINNKTTNELIGNISNMVDELPWGPVYNATKYVITNPYVLDVNKIPNPIIDVYIDSCGGLLNSTKSIMMLLNLARAKGAIIRTINMGNANSCASLIAIQGTPNFRIMYEQAYNKIHYGQSSFTIDRQNDVDPVIAFEKEMRTGFFAPYLQHTDLTKKELNSMMQTEFVGCMNAKTCLEKRMCDWVLTNDGRFINRQNMTEHFVKKR